MAIYRNVRISFWSDSKIVLDFTPEDKCFYLYLLTNPHTNLSGCYEITPKQIASELGYDEDTVDELIDRFQRVHNVITYNSQTHELFLHNWAKYNWTSSSKFRTALAKEFPQIKCPEFLTALREKFDGSTVSIPYPDGMDTTATDSVSDSDSVSGPQFKGTIRHTYGSYHNVVLTDEEIEQLKSEFQDWQERIERLSKYMASVGKSYADHCATIRLWASKDAELHKPRSTVCQETARGVVTEQLRKDMEWLENFTRQEME